MPKNSKSVKSGGLFEDVSKTRHSKVWKYYLFNSETTQAKCLLCYKELAAKGSSTKNLLDHLSKIHSVDPNTIKEKQRQQAITNHTKHILEPI